MTVSEVKLVATRRSRGAVEGALLSYSVRLGCDVTLGNAGVHSRGRTKSSVCSCVLKSIIITLRGLFLGFDIPILH